MRFASAAVPLRSNSRSGIEAEPLTASFTDVPSTVMSSTAAMPLVIFKFITILSNGVRPLRNSPPPERGRRSSRRSNCSTLSPASAPLRPVRVASPLSVRVTREHALAGPFGRQRHAAAASEPAHAEQLSKAGLEVDVGKIELRLQVDAFALIGERHRAL